MQIRGLIVDIPGSRVWVQGEEVWLTKTEFQVLSHLVRSRGRVVSRAELLHVVWGHKRKFPTRAVDNLIARLRRKLKDPADSSRLIHTRWGLGYSLDADTAPP